MIGATVTKGGEKAMTTFPARSSQGDAGVRPELPGLFETRLDPC
jgi:hypothetical protein